jgi:hypothetical protein
MASSDVDYVIDNIDSVKPSNTIFVWNSLKLAREHFILFGIVHVFGSRTIRPISRWPVLFFPTQFDPNFTWQIEKLISK